MERKEIGSMSGLCFLIYEMQHDEREQGSQTQIYMRSLFDKKVAVYVANMVPLKLQFLDFVDVAGRTITSGGPRV